MLCLEREIIRRDLPAPVDYRTNDPKGESLVFGMLEGVVGMWGSVFVFVVFF